MAKQATIEAESRDNTGKGIARSLRRAGRIPAVIYGRGREPEALSIDTTSLTRLLTQVSASTTLVEVAVDGKTTIKALIREIQRNPVRPSDIIHLDLYAGDAADQAAEVERLISLGATRVDWDLYPPEPDFVVLADTEGNRFCVIDTVGS